MPAINPISGLELMSALAEGEESARKCGWVSMDSVMKMASITGHVANEIPRRALDSRHRGP